MIDIVRTPQGTRRTAAVAVGALTALTLGIGALPTFAADPDDAAAHASHSLRSPVTDENFYFVMADRFANGDPGNDTGGLGDDPMVSGFDPTKQGFYQGGDLDGILENLDYIEGLGTTSIWLTPSFKNRAVQPEDSSAGYHGYWVTDFTQIDPHLGTNDDLRALVDEAHARGMKVYFDIITNHTADVIGYEDGERQPYVSKDEEPYRSADGEEFDDRDYAGSDDFPELDADTSFPYVPVLEPGEEDLKVPGWLNDPTLYHNRGDTTFAGEDAYYGDFFGLDDLFTEHPAVVEGMIDVYSTWIADFGIDGFRIDTMKHVNDEFWQEFGPRVLEFAREQGKDEFFMFGEVFDLSRPFTSTFTTRNEMQAVLDFPFQDAARKFASSGDSAESLASFFEGDDWYTDADSNAYQLPTFLGNHDMGRIGWMIQSDNPDAGDEEWLARDRLAHELMYFSRGNPVIYYGDEQGFTGTGGDQAARQTLFPSQVPSYLEHDLLGTDATHADANFDTGHPLYEALGGLAELTREHPALRDGAHQNRYASDGAGVYAFSRIDAKEQREYVVALNNSEQEQTAEIPTWIPKRNFELIYGDGAADGKTTADGGLAVTVPPLSAVVYQSSGRIPASKAAPRPVLAEPVPAEQTPSRMHVAASVEGNSFYEVTFVARVDGGDWTPIGTDDNAPYQVFHDVAGLEPGTPLEYRAVVLDNRRHTAVSDARSTESPAPAIDIEIPGEGAAVSGTVQVRAVADPDGSGYSVTIERSVDGGEWEPIGTDDSAPAYTAADDVSALADGTEVRYRAVLDYGAGQVTSDIRTVTVGAPDQPDEVSVPGSHNSEIGCAGDWMPDCEEAQLTLDPATGLWTLTVTLPAGSFEYKAAINRAWDENYGAGGARNGGNIALTLAEESQVTFTYDHATHVISAEVAGGGGEPESTVSVPGSHNSEMGCPDDWAPACADAELTQRADGVWEGTFDLPAGDYSFKVALDGGWAENYGAGGAPDGPDITYTHDGGELTFYFDPTTKYAFNDAMHPLMHVVGSVQSELGCPGDWAPDCLRGLLIDPDGDGTFAFQAGELPAADYEVKVVHGTTWAENYGADGIRDGGNIGFTATAGNPVGFAYDSGTHVLTVQ